jgi:hypothetical protein
MILNPVFAAVLAVAVLWLQTGRLDDVMRNGGV